MKRLDMIFKPAYSAGPPELMGAQEITTAGFLSEFLARHKQMSDRPFCWVLGSGASYQSGIPTGVTLAQQWLRELHEREDFNVEQHAHAFALRVRDELFVLENQSFHDRECNGRCRVRQLIFNSSFSRFFLENHWRLALLRACC
jgi:hypothetical protein